MGITVTGGLYNSRRQIRFDSNCKKRGHYKVPKPEVAEVFGF